ncbi:MAG: hypothetical protein J5382_04595 [Bacteroidales bacterium]|nr:hypothetical protein [Bacteroidales bacterium]
MKEQDIKDFVLEQSSSKEKLFSLKSLIESECGWLFRVKESSIPEVEAYREEQRKKVRLLAMEIANIEKDEQSEVHELPKILDTPVFRSLLSRAEQAGLVLNNHWNSPTKLSRFAALVNKTPGAMNAKPYTDGKLLKWKPFEDYFNQSNLCQYAGASIKTWSTEDLETDLFYNQQESLLP